MSDITSNDEISTIDDDYEIQYLIDSLKTWYTNKQKKPNRGGIRSVLSSFLLAETTSCDSMSDKRSSRSHSNASINNPTITLDVISNNKNSVTIPESSVIIEKKLLNTVLNDHIKATDVLNRLLPPKVNKFFIDFTCS